MYDNTVTLPNGVAVPMLGLGTWRVPDETVEDVVRRAVQLCYRHFYTAQVYGNERGVGEAVRTCGVPREELFVTSKVSAYLKDYASAAQSIDESLKTTGLDYLDLMLIHNPQPVTASVATDDRCFEGNREVWRALEDAYRAGKLRAIGISNFHEVDVENVWETATVKPMVNQVLCHISNSPLTLIDYCQKKGIVMEAYSPIAHGVALKNETIVAMAARYGVSAAQLCIRFVLQLGMIALPKAVDPRHQQNNTELDFTISDADMHALKTIEHIKDYGEFSSYRVYRTQI